MWSIQIHHALFIVLFPMSFAMLASDNQTNSWFTKECIMTALHQSRKQSISIFHYSQANLISCIIRNGIAAQCKRLGYDLNALKIPLKKSFFAVSAQDILEVSSDILIALIGFDLQKNRILSGRYIRGPQLSCIGSMPDSKELMWSYLKKIAVFRFIIRKMNLFLEPHIIEILTLIGKKTGLFKEVTTDDTTVHLISDIVSQGCTELGTLTLRYIFKVSIGYTLNTIKDTILDNSFLDEISNTIQTRINNFIYPAGENGSST